MNEPVLSPKHNTGVGAVYLRAMAVLTHRCYAHEISCYCLGLSREHLQSGKREEIAQNQSIREECFCDTQISSKTLLQTTYLMINFFQLQMHVREAGLES